MDELITDWFGLPIGKIHTDEDGRSEVTTWEGKPLGSADKNGTRDFLGRPVSKQNVPGLLFSEQHNPLLREEADEKRRREELRLKTEHDQEVALQGLREREEELKKEAEERSQREEESRRNEEERNEINRRRSFSTQLSNELFNENYRRRTSGCTGYYFNEEDRKSDLEKEEKRRKKFDDEIAQLREEEEYRQWQAECDKQRREGWK